MSINFKKSLMFFKDFINQGIKKIYIEENISYTVWYP